MTDYNTKNSKNKMMKKIDKENDAQSCEQEQSSQPEDGGRTELLLDYRGDNSVGSYISDSSSVSTISTLTGVSQRTILSRMAIAKRKKLQHASRRRRNYYKETSKSTILMHRFMVLVSFGLSCYVMDQSVSSLFGLEDDVVQSLRGGDAASIMMRGYGTPSDKSSHGDDDGASYNGKPVPDSPPSGDITVFAKLDFDWKTGKLIDRSMEREGEDKDTTTKTSGASLPTTTTVRKEGNSSSKTNSKGAVLPTGTVSKGTTLPLTTTTNKREEDKKASEVDNKNSSKANKEQAKDSPKSNEDSLKITKHHSVDTSSVDFHYNNYMKEQKLMEMKKKQRDNKISSDSSNKKPAEDRKEEPLTSEDELMTVRDTAENEQNDDDTCQSDCTDVLPRMSDLQAMGCTLLVDYAQFCQRPAWKQYQFCQQSCSENGYPYRTKKCCPRPNDQAALMQIVEDSLEVIEEER